MLDVLHYFFEEDYRHASQESALRMSAVRETIYQDLYGVDYPYALKKDGTSRGAQQYDFDPEEEALREDDAAPQMKQFNPKEASKSYIQPTKVQEGQANPFSGILDAPFR